MKILTNNELAEAYLKIQISAMTVDESLLAFYINQSRHDARLAEITTEHIRDCWWKHDPVVLNDLLKKQEFPNAILVMVEQLITFPEIGASIRTQFTNWTTKSKDGIKAPEENQLYFINIVKEGSAFYKIMVNETIESYSKFNFIGRAILFNKQIPKKILSKEDYDNRYNLPS